MLIHYLEESDLSLKQFPMPSQNNPLVWPPNPTQERTEFIIQAHRIQKY